MVKLNVQVGHVHMVMVIPPKYGVARVLQYIKSHSAKALKAKFPFLGKAYFSKRRHLVPWLLRVLYRLG
ncbi:MAG: transposase [Thermodesulfobacteriota bacterium]